MASSDNKCKACGQWSGKGHKCPPLGAVKSPAEPVVFDAGTRSESAVAKWREKVEERVAAAQSSLEKTQGVMDDTRMRDAGDGGEVPTPADWAKHGWKATTFSTPEGTKVIPEHMVGVYEQHYRRLEEERNGTAKTDSRMCVICGYHPGEYNYYGDGLYCYDCKAAEDRDRYA